MPGVLTGLLPACHTPFDRDGALNLAAVEQQAALFLRDGAARRLHRRYDGRICIADA